MISNFNIKRAKMFENFEKRKLEVHAQTELLKDNLQKRGQDLSELKVSLLSFYVNVERKSVKTFWHKGVKSKISSWRL
jgi:hypothetical protein